MHKDGKASKYTRSRLPVSLAAKRSFKTKSEAMKHEIKFKSLSRKTKMIALKQGF
jgi:putative endonuclease